MTSLLYEYNLDPTTWVYLASLLAITVFFKFSPLIRLRNLDMLGLVAIAPGLVIVRESASGGYAQYVGQVWLFCACAFFLVRMLADPMLVRRPLLEPNLNTGGMTFLFAALLIFMTMHMVNGPLPPESGPQALSLFGGMPAAVLAPESGETLARVLTVIGHLGLVACLVLVGYRHYQNLNAGVAVATLFLLLPSTSLLAGRADLAIAGLLLVAMALAYRHPIVSGSLLGVATGAVFYPVFLLPLWCGFYWQRGLVRYLLGFAVSLLVVCAAVLATAGGSALIAEPLAAFSLNPPEGASGLWGMVFETPYRIPVLVGYVVMCVGFAIWPVQKNLGTLLSCSTAVMIGTQFWLWQASGGFVGWYLPLLLLAVFRPNLEDRIALSVLGEGWRTKFIGKQAA